MRPSCRGPSTCCTRPASSRPTPGEERGVIGLVRVGCYPSLAPTVLPVLVSEFTTAHPDARVEIYENTQDELTHRLESGELDLAIMYDLDLDPTWKSAQLAQLEPRAVLPATHRLADSNGPIDLGHLRNDPMVLAAWLRSYCSILQT